MRSLSVAEVKASVSRKIGGGGRKGIRTAAELAFEVSLLEVASQPMYQRVARKCLQLQQLGLSHSAIGRRLEVTDKTVAKAIKWLDGMSARL